MKHIITRACGHKEEVQLFGNSRERERKIKWLEGCICSDCEEAEQKKFVEEKTKERGLPALVGTPKQVDWANRIRVYRLADMDEWAEKSAERLAELEQNLARYTEEGNESRIERTKNKIAVVSERFSKAVKTVEGMSGITNASWWIDNREHDPERLVQDYEAFQDIKRERDIREEAATTMVVMEPESRETTTVVTLTATTDSVIATSDKDDLVRSILKTNGFTWDRFQTAWVKRETERRGKVKDLLPDTARKLLEHGIPVRASREVKEAVESGNYQRQCYRWVDVSNYGDKLAIDVVPSVKSYPSGRFTYDGDYVLVDPTEWRAVREFCSLNGYRVTELAERMLVAAEAATVSVKLPQENGKLQGEEDPLKAILDSPRDVLEDLKEEDDE